MPIKQNNLAYEAYAEIYAHENSTSASIPTGNAYTKIILVNSVIGNYKNCTVDLQNGDVIVSKAGTYLVNGTFSSKLGTTDVIWDTTIFVNGVEANNLHMRRKFSIAGYTFNVCISGLLELKAGDILDVRVKHNNAGAVAITNEFTNININCISN